MIIDYKNLHLEFTKNMKAFCKTPKKFNRYEIKTNNMIIKFSIKSDNSKINFKTN